jgi:hypothetical protein
LGEIQGALTPHALRALVMDGHLVRLGYGVYGRAMVSRLSGKPMLHGRDGFSGVARQALDKLGVEWQPTQAERAYNEGRSTQVPVKSPGQSGSPRQGALLAPSPLP